MAFYPLMKKMIPFLITVSLLLSGCGSKDERLIPAQVVRVVDGDTMEVAFDGQTETVRLLLVDTPETKHPDKPVQPFGPDASKLAKSTLEGKEVELEMDVSERDKYGRLLAYLWVDGNMFNEMLLEKGLARVAYIYPPNVKYVDEFRSIQAKAQKKETGIWSIENYARQDGFHPETAKSSGSNAQTETGSGTQEPIQSASGTSSNSCEKPRIKGNKNSRNQKIYHVPEGRYYEITKPEQWFCSTKDAEAAGYRASKD